MIDLVPLLVPVVRGAATNVFRLLLLKILSDVPYQFNEQILPRSSYDFVIVGAGTAGSVIAGRLAEAGASVLVLEAGGSAPPESSVPGFMPLMVGSDADYHIKLAPQKNTQQAFVDNASFLALGKSVGGGSSINGMVYTRGDKKDFDHWASLGNEGWDYNSVLPYFKKSEDFRGHKSKSTDQYHGKGGPLSVEAVKFPSKVSTAFLRAGKQMGYDIIDENGPTRIGFTPLQYVVKNGVRASTSESFLRPLADKENLFVLAKAQVTKILFTDDKKAKGVRFTFNNKEYFVSANKEVIVSCGAIHTPKLLMHSGVGPKHHLQDFKIPVVAPVEGVGRNLQDHPTILNLPFAVNPGSSLSLGNYVRHRNLKDYIKFRKGEFSDPFGIQGAAFVSLGGEDPSWPDLQVMLLNGATSNYGPIASRISYDLKQEAYDTLLAPLEGSETIVLAPTLIRPDSRGRVTLKSSNPKDSPSVDFNFLSDPNDLKKLLKGIQLSMAISKTSALQAVGTTFKSKPLHGCTHHPVDSDEYWECFARRLVSTTYHPAGTCKMGPTSDPLAVLSPRLKVHGVTGVRVADGSIMPTIIGGNTMATIIMIGEKAADMIKQDWNI